MAINEHMSMLKAWIMTELALFSVNLIEGYECFHRNSTEEMMLITVTTIVWHAQQSTLVGCFSCAYILSNKYPTHPTIRAD